MDDSTQKLVDNIVKKGMMDIANQSQKSAASRPAPASQGPARLPGEPILFEKDGWGIYTPDEANSEFTTGGMEGSCLTHIGCDCVFPYWSFSHPHNVGDYEFLHIKCEECGERLSKETYKALVYVYNFITK